MKKKEESEKRERKKKVVCAAVATVTRQISTLILGVRKCEISKSCLWTRCSTLEYVARNYTKTEVRKWESGISLPCLWTLPQFLCRNRTYFSESTLGSGNSQLDFPLSHHGGATVGYYQAHGHI